MEPGDSGKDSSWEDAFILDALLVATPEAFILYNLEGRPLRWNKSYNELTGYSDDEIRTMNAMEFHPEESIKYVAEAFGEVVQTGNPMYIETNVLNKSGRAIPCSLSGSLLKDADGKPVGLLGVGRDITERKRAEEVLGESLKRFQDIVENTKEWIWEVDSKGEYTYASSVIERVLGYRPEEVIGRHFYDFFHPEDREELKKVALEVFKRKEPFAELVNRNSDKDGQDVWLSTSGVPILGESGELLGYRGADVDITERKLMEEELRKHRENLEELVEMRTTELAEANRQLEKRIAEKEKAEAELLQSNRELDAYAHTVSHELRNPLSGIYLAVEWMERLGKEPGGPQAGAEIERIARQIKENIERSEEHIKNLLELAEAGQGPVETREVDLKQVVEDVMAMSAEYTGGNEVEVELDDDMGCLRASPTHIHQLFSNLMENAIKHNAGRDLKIEVSHLGIDRDGGHRYLFRDNGSGVAPENIGKIFQPFYSGTNETGIGLATVAKIVKVYGGSIRAYNDNGACFEFVIRDYPRE